MTAVPSVPLFAGFALVAVVALVLIRKTRLFWVPGVAWMGYAGAIYLARPWYDTGDLPGFEGFWNLLHVVVSFVVVASGLVCWLVGARARSRVRRTEIPRAIVAKNPRRGASDG